MYQSHSKLIETQWSHITGQHFIYCNNFSRCAAFKFIKIKMSSNMSAVGQLCNDNKNTGIKQ